MMEDQFQFILQLANEGLRDSIKKFEKAIPKYTQISEENSDLYDIITKFLENEETEITIKQKQDILKYLSNLATAEAYIEAVLYLKGITDGMKLSHCFGW